MRLHKIAVIFALFVALAGWPASRGLAQTTAQSAHRAQHPQGFSEAGKAELSHQLNDAVSRGDTPGVVALVAGRDGVLYEDAAGKLDAAQNIAMPMNAIFPSPR
jgi:hypothetical protein